MNGDLDYQLEKLTKAVEQSNRQRTLWYSALHGIVVGVGSTVGAAVILLVVALLFRNLIGLPYLGSLGRLLPKLEQVLEETSQSRTETFPPVVPAPAEQEQLPSSPKTLP